MNTRSGWPMKKWSMRNSVGPVRIISPWPVTRWLAGSSRSPSISIGWPSPAGVVRFSTAPIRATSSFTEKGLTTKSSAPASNPLSLSRSSPFAVSMMMGMLRVGSLRRSLRASSRPLTPGSIQSRRMRSGRECEISRSAWAASATVRVSKPARDRACSTISRMAASSSTRRMRLPTAASLSITVHVGISYSRDDVFVTTRPAAQGNAPRPAAAGVALRPA